MNGNYYSKWIQKTTFKYPQFMRVGSLVMWTLNLGLWSGLLFVHPSISAFIFFPLSLFGVYYWGRLTLSKWFYDRTIDNYCDKD
jgi:hypothetical protein